MFFAIAKIKNITVFLIHTPVPTSIFFFVYKKIIPIKSEIHKVYLSKKKIAIVIAMLSMSGLK